MRESPGRNFQVLLSAQIIAAELRAVGTNQKTTAASHYEMRQPEFQSRFGQGFGGGAAGACSFGGALGCSFGVSFGASFGCSFGSALGAALGSIEMSSTSKMSVEFGPMGEPGACPGHRRILAPGGPADDGA